MYIPTQIQINLLKTNHKFNGLLFVTLSLQCFLTKPTRKLNKKNWSIWVLSIKWSIISCKNIIFNWQKHFTANYKQKFSFEKKKNPNLSYSEMLFCRHSNQSYGQLINNNRNIKYFKKSATSGFGGVNDVNDDNINYVYTFYDGTIESSYSRTVFLCCL